MNISKGRFIIIVAAAFAAGVILSLAVMVCVGSLGQGGSQAGVSNAKLAQIKAYIDKYYLEDYEEQDLIDNAYRGYVAGLEDPYSAYMTAEEYDNYESSSLGEYSGIGVTFQEDEKGNFVVVNVSKGSPADKAGIEADDLLLKVNGKVYADSDIMASHIRGKKGTRVKLTYLHNGSEKTVTLVRDKIVQKSVEYEMLDGKTARIAISEFVTSTSKDFDKALEAVQKKGADRLILDLRDNGGGLVDDAIDVADQFLDDGVACYVRDKNGRTEEYRVRDGKTDLETVVLVNGNSASASEILAAALQDNGYTIVGEKTFGKGIIQSPFRMKDGDALKLTILEYLSPDKHKVHKKGIKPDVKVKDDKDTEEDEQLEKAREMF